MCGGFQKVLRVQSNVQLLITTWGILCLTHGAAVLNWSDGGQIIALHAWPTVMEDFQPN